MSSTISLRNETVLLTGASTGIGLELAKIFAAERYPLILVARSTERLRDLAADLKTRFGIPVTFFSKDLSDPKSPEELYGDIQKAGLQVDILVNNAGVGLHGRFEKTELKKELDMIQLNVAALTHLTKLFLNDMIARKRGKILNVASTAAFQPGPLMAVYYATKAYVLYFSEALSYEVKGQGINVTTLCPGPTRSDFQKTANIGRNALTFKFGTMSAEKVARIGYRALIQGKPLVIAGFFNTFMAFMTRLTPRAILTKIVFLIQKE